MAKKSWMFLGVVSLLVGGASASARDAPRTAYPIVFAHGMAGFDDIAGYDYWGDDYGQFVLDPCDGFLETSCNGDISSSQKSYVSAVTPFQSSEVRGTQLADNIESYMATSGTAYVNIVGHSQGGIDARKAARVLRQRRGYRVVRYMISVSSPHRGSPVARYVLDHFGGTVAETLANYFGSVVYGPGNDAVASMKTLIYDDADPNDGMITGAADFNAKYPGGTDDIERMRSLMTAQNGGDVNPLLWLVSNAMYNIDGDGACTGDCDGDGAWGTGDGNRTNRDDDGLVGVNSQHAGYRLEYTDDFWDLDRITLRTDVNGDGSADFVSNLNAPSTVAATSMSYVISQDHVDVIGVGPDMFDEMEFYAAITEFIAVTGM